jgi:hypothetical protein
MAISKRVALAWAFLPALAGGCGGGALTTPATSPQATQIVQVANEGSNSIASYALGRSGNIAPERALGGPNTGLQQPIQVWPIPNSLVYVVSRGNNSIRGFSDSADGDAAPEVVIAGPKTTLRDPSGIQLDTTNAIWVANTKNDAIVTFAAGANGDVAPIASIAGPNTGLREPISLHIGFRNGEVYALNGGTNSVEVFAKGSTGNAAPMQRIEGSNTGLRGGRQLELDSHGDIWVANSGGGDVLEFGPDATGNVAPIDILTLASGLPFHPTGVAFDPSDNLVVSDSSLDVLYEFDASATKGRAQPAAIVRGPQTGLHSPQHIGIPQAIATPIPG